MSNVIKLVKGSLVRRNSREFIVRDILNETEVLLTDISENVNLVAAISSLEPIRNDEAVAIPDLAAISEEAWSVAEQRFRVVHALLDRRTTVKDCAEAARNAGIHPATLYRWRQRLLREGSIAALIPRKCGRVAGRKVLDAAIEEVIQSCIKEVYLQPARATFGTLHEDILIKCRELKLRAPHINTVRARLRDIPRREVVMARLGSDVAEQAYGTNMDTPAVADLLDVVQIDHTLLNIIVVDDESRLPIGRPWITVVMDVATRVVLGFCLALEPPGALSVGLALCHAIRMKEHWAFGLKLSTDCDWPFFGVPKFVHADNAKEFRGEMLKRACTQYQINLQWRPVKKPNWGGHIERYMGTLSEKLKGLPGATFSNPKERGNFPSEKSASMTLKELERYLATIIDGEYHRKVHSSLGISPREAWRRGITCSAKNRGCGLPPFVDDEERLRMDLLPFVERTITDYGVRIKGIHYYADVLRPYTHATIPGRARIKRQFIFRYDPRDISEIYLWDEKNSRYHPIPYRNTGLPPISLWELQAVRRRLREKGLTQDDESVIFNTYKELRRQISTSEKATKRARRQAQAKRLSGKPAKTTQSTMPIEHSSKHEQFAPDMVGIRFRS
ncbi:MAG: Mu transposase C-terminal domain-containing protein [Candidatus Methylacidiphilales bacterium]|nr:Mu transposase C-terminal domain-containing protein [Candidatus Methylacidiphilales bacterium]